MKYFSMFSGIGGFELGIQQANSNRVLGNRQQPTEKIDIRQEQDITDSTGELGNGGWKCAECIGYSEIDKYADKIYQKHFGGRNFGDATKINARELPDFDLLVGGFPCQAFSIAGKRAGFNDTRGTLFFDIARICKEKRPRHLVLENVKGLLSHDTGKTFQTILRVLADLGYFVEWQVLNSKDFGVPQNRERVFIVGHLGGEPRRKVFPITGTNRKDTRIIGKDVAYTIDANYHKGTNTLAKSRRSVVGVAIRTRAYAGKPARIRRLTPLECERLQGFPDNWTEGLSDTQRYKTLGNAVTVNVVEAVISNLIGGK
jgi:DNA (cytosine-5)-methyltransferase 1